MESPNDIKDLKLLVSVLLKRIDDLENEIVTLHPENGKLREEHSSLQSRLKLNSKNSHKPSLIAYCGQSLYGAFPEKVSQPDEYGFRIKALSVLLNNDYKLPLQKIEPLMRDLWGCSLNESTVANTNAGIYDSLQVVERYIRHLKIKQKVATHFITCKGAQHYARIQSFFSRLRKYSLNVFQNFIKILDGERVVFQAG